MININLDIPLAISVYNPIKVFVDNYVGYYLGISVVRSVRNPVWNVVRRSVDDIDEYLVEYINELNKYEIY